MFEDWMKANFPAFDVATLSDEQKASFQKLFDADQADADPDDPDADADLEADGEDDDDTDADKDKKAMAAKAAAARKAKKLRGTGTGGRRRGDDGSSADRSIERMRAETLRQQKIGRLCAARDRDAQIDKIYEQGIRGDLTVEGVELAVMRASRSAPSGASSGDADPGIESETIIAALLMNTASMSASRLKAFGISERAGNEATSGRWQGASLRTVVEHLSQRMGCAARATEGYAAQTRAARATNERLAAAGFSQLTLNYILENVQNKVLLDAYQAVETVWQLFCAPTSNPDFKIYGRYALDNQSVFQKVGSQGQMQELKMGDRKYTTELDTYGGRFGVDRKTWINDDLGAINARVAQVGMIGAKTIDLLANMTLLAGIGNTALFHASNANYLANSVANYSLDVTGLTNARSLFSNQVGPDKQPLGVNLDTLMHGVALQPKANALFTSEYLNQEISNAATVKGQANKNPFYNMFKPNENKFLSNTAIKDFAGAALAHQDDGLWMLFGKQGNNAPLYIAFLNGQQAPTTLTEANTAAVLGFELVVFLDVGLGYGDPRLAVCMNPNNA